MMLKFRMQDPSHRNPRFQETEQYSTPPSLITRNSPEDWAPIKIKIRKTTFIEHLLHGS